MYEHCGAILLAGGMGKRYGEKKQDIIFHNKPIWKHVYDTLACCVDEENIHVVGKDIPGGDTRTESVRNGLCNFKSDIRRIVILEAARPMVTKTQIEELLKDNFPSTTFVRPLVNTVIFRDVKYVNRNDLYELLTPQAFDLNLLINAYNSNKYHDVTDETRIMYEFYGIKPHFIETNNNLYKITYPGDLDIIESIYIKQQKGEYI